MTAGDFHFHGFLRNGSKALVRREGEFALIHSQLCVEKLKQFMSESDSKISSIRQYSDHRTRSRRR